MQVSIVLRKTQGGYMHHCPGCDRAHILPDSWTFVNENLDSPTFRPSFKHTWGNGRCCHYMLTDGVLEFCKDSTHSLANIKVPLPHLTDEERDWPDATEPLI